MKIPRDWHVAWKYVQKFDGNLSFVVYFTMFLVSRLNGIE
jgi:hypothetical protein